MARVRSILPLLLLLLPFVELWLFIQIGGRLGFLPSLVLVVSSALFGISLARQQGYGVLRQMQEDVASGRPPTDRMTEGVFVLFAGLLLLIPGFLTDAIGLALLVPPVRGLLQKRLNRRYRVSAEEAFRQSPFGPGEPVDEREPAGTPRPEDRPPPSGGVLEIEPTRVRIEDEDEA